MTARVIIEGTRDECADVLDILHTAGVVRNTTIAIGPGEWVIAAADVTSAAAAPDVPA